MNEAGNTLYLEDKKLAPAHLGDVLVLGLGKSGRATVAYLADMLGSRVSKLHVAAGETSDEAQHWAEAYRARGVRIVFDNEHIEGHYNLCVASPGISEFSHFYQNAAESSDEIISEVEFAWRESEKSTRWVAITGTNGKTTTTALTAHLLSVAGMRARAVGNIGDTCIETVAAHTVDVYVAEVSSYQAASTCNFAPDVAVVLNITPDHLSWHKTHENYAAAKWKLLANLAKVQGVAVLNATNNEVRAKIRELKAVSDEKRGFAYIPLGTAEGITHDMRAKCGATNAAWVEDSVLHVAYDGDDQALCTVDQLQIRGSHNVENALAAASAALVLGVSADVVREALCTFAPLEHRIEPAGVVNGITCYNDSKATNVDATQVALSAFSPKKPIVLLGGRDKGTDLAPLVEACEKHVYAAVVFGEARDRFAQALRGAKSPVEVLEANSLEEALDQALSVANEGDVVLLSPACASFDQFSCFEERGQVFKQLVAERASGSVA